MSENNQEADIERAKSACLQLGEHFDTVQIFCTRHEQGEECGTVNVAYGVGNWFARRGQVGEWILKEEQSTREAVIRKERGE